MTRRTTSRADTPLRAPPLEPALRRARQLETAAGAAPDGQARARVEALAAPAAREPARQAAQAARQAPAQGAEKKGRPAAPVPAGGASGARARSAAMS